MGRTVQQNFHRIADRYPMSSIVARHLGNELWRGSLPQGLWHEQLPDKFLLGQSEKSRVISLCFITLLACLSLSWDYRPPFLGAALKVTDPNLRFLAVFCENPRRLSSADATLPPVALQGVATPPSRLFPQFRGCRRGVAATPP